MGTHLQSTLYSKTSVKRPHSKRPKSGFHDQLSLNAGHKYCNTLDLQAIIPFVIKLFVFSSFEWPFYTGFTVNTHPSPLLLGPPAKVSLYPPLMRRRVFTWIENSGRNKTEKNKTYRV